MIRPHHLVMTFILLVVLFAVAVLAGAFSELPGVFPWQASQPTPTRWAVPTLIGSTPTEPQPTGWWTEMPSPQPVLRATATPAATDLP